MLAMRTPVRSLAAALLVAVAAHAAVSAQPPVRKWLTYDQVFGSAPAPGERAAAAAGVLGDLPAIAGWLDDDRYLETREDPADKQRKLFVVSAADGAASVYRDYAAMAKDLPQGFDPRAAAASMPDGSALAFTREHDLFYFDANARRLRRLTANPGDEQNPRFSPDGKWVAYTRDSNLYAYDLTNEVEHQYTTDGSDTVYNGWSSWVYMEEILGRASRYAAFWWSPDSAKLAFMRFDDGPVPVFPIYHADGQHGEIERQRYPKAGDPNPYAQMGVVSVADGKLAWVDFESKADHYIAWPSWTPDSRSLTVQWMNRAQDTIRFYACDPVTGKKAPIFEERQPSWVEWFEDLYYFHDGSGFLLRSDVDGWSHLYAYGMDGTLKRRLTSGEWQVTSIARVDETRGTVYFMARPARKSWDSQLMRVRLDGTGLEQLTKGDGTHAARVSPGGSYFIDSLSDLSTPAKMALYRTDGTLVRPLGDAHTAATGEYAWGRAELFTIPSGDGYDLPASWVLPPDFDAKKQYPVIFSIYGGPNAGTVRNAFPGLQPHYWAERGVITISVDHRGSGHFGKKGVALMHRNLGKWEMTDLITATKWLRAKPFVAKDRIGITGSSYGGYTTMMALTYGAGEFNYGIASSSVTDWQLYDTVYTERYMDTPKENPEGYKAGAVLTYADRYKGGTLRITHGTIDDNVHTQNSIQVIDWLTNHDRLFELMLFPDSRHGIQPGQRAFLTRGTHDFWVRTLLGGRLPPEPGARKKSTDQ
jgi:dipeptidyl-peptidase-4